MISQLTGYTLNFQTTTKKTVVYCNLLISTVELKREECFVNGMNQADLCLLEISGKQMCKANVWPYTDVKREERGKRFPLCVWLAPSNRNKVLPRHYAQTLKSADTYLRKEHKPKLVSRFHDTYSEINP